MTIVASKITPNPNTLSAQNSAFLTLITMLNSTGTVGDTKSGNGKRKKE